MDWNQLLISCLPAIVTSSFAYLVSRQRNKSDISKLKEKHKHEFQMLKEATQSQIDVLKAQAESNTQADLTNATANFLFDLLGKVATGEVNPEQLKKLGQLAE